MRVLFIGNSHTYCNDMPQIFAQICRAEGVETAIAMLAHGGVGWDFHWKEPEARFNLLYGGYDAVVLQHCAHPMGDLQVMAQAGAALIRLAKAAGARPILYMTWTQEADGEQAQPAMSRAYTSLAQAEGGALAPVGNAWWILRRLSPDTELEKGEAGFFGLLKYYIVQFFYSFLTDYASIGVVDMEMNESIKVWLASGRDQSQILKQMINDSFTPDNSIAVDLQLVTASALLPSVIAGTAPDVYMGMAQTDPVNLAM